MAQRIYKSWTVKIIFGRYANGRMAMQLRHATDGDPIATCTVNLPDDELGPDEVFIKDYTENEGMFRWLIDQLVIEDTGRTIQSGHVKIPIGRLLMDPKRCEQPDEQ